MNGAGGTILVVDDEASIRRALVATLGALGLRADEASNGIRGIELAKRNRYETILLDINIPGTPGIEVCRELRRELPAAGILMLTVRDGEGDKVEAFDAGADDYVTKPFAIRELMARVRAVRRGRAPGRERSEVFVIGDLVLDPASYKVTKAGLRLHMTPREFDILEYLMRRAGMAVRHEALLKAVWGPEYGGELEYLRTFVRQLRKKIEDDASNPEYLLTEPFVGYRFRDQ